MDIMWFPALKCSHYYWIPFTIQVLKCVLQSITSKPGDLLGKLMGIIKIIQHLSNVSMMCFSTNLMLSVYFKIDNNENKTTENQFRANLKKEMKDFIYRRCKGLSDVDIIPNDNSLIE